MIHRPARMQWRRRRRAFLVMDMMIGLGMVLVLLMISTGAFIHQNRAERKLSAIRAAARQAESALLSLQSGAPLPPQAHVEKLNNPAPTGFAWIRLSLPAVGEGPAQTLVGLASADALSHVPLDGGARP